jgi:hypothetical protein
MALIIQCDGCYTALEDDAVEVRGIVIKRQYCEACAVVADDFSKHRDELHTTVSKKWNDEMAKAVKKFVKDNPDFALPDVQG